MCIIIPVTTIFSSSSLNFKIKIIGETSTDNVLATSTPHFMANNDIDKPKVNPNYMKFVK